MFVRLEGREARLGVFKICWVGREVVGAECVIEGRCKLWIEHGVWMLVTGSTSGLCGFRGWGVRVRGGG